MFKRLFLFLNLVTIYVAAQTHPLHELYQFGDALNIEGARIANEHLNEKQIWSNICIVLDRPFEDGAEWQQITDANVFPLKESSLPEYNESLVNLAYVSILHYYISHAHSIASLSTDRTANIMIQVHRNTSGSNQNELLRNLLSGCFPDLRMIETPGSFKNENFCCYFPDVNVNVRFCYGVRPDNLIAHGVYQQADIVLSYSLVAGFNREWKSGSLLVPKSWMPFSLKQMSIYPNQSYACSNHLLEVLDDILRYQTDELINYINENFCSPNVNKHHRTDYLKISDFKVANLLQVDEIFNPSQLPSNFCIE